MHNWLCGNKRRVVGDRPRDTTSSPDNADL